MPMLQWICQEEEVDHLSNSRITKLRAHPIPHNVRQRTNLLLVLLNFIYFALEPLSQLQANMTQRILG